MTMEKVLWLGGFLLFSNGDRTVNTPSSVVTDKRADISENVKGKQSSCIIHKATSIPTKNEKSPCIKSDYSNEMTPNRKAANNYPSIMTKRPHQVGQKFPQVLPHRPIYHEVKKMGTALISPPQQAIKPDQRNKAQISVQICHARKFNRSYLRQKSLTE